MTDLQDRSLTRSPSLLWMAVCTVLVPCAANKCLEGTCQGTTTSCLANIKATCDLKTGWSCVTTIKDGTVNTSCQNTPCPSTTTMLTTTALPGTETTTPSASVASSTSTTATFSTTITISTTITSPYITTETSTLSTTPSMASTATTVATSTDEASSSSAGSLYLRNKRQATETTVCCETHMCNAHSQSTAIRSNFFTSSLLLMVGACYKHGHFF